MSEIRCYIFAELRGAHPSWSLAVMAVGERDAREYVRIAHGGGRLVQKPQPGASVKASCGATTEAAQSVLRERNRREQEQLDAAFERCKRDHPEADEGKIYRLVGYYL